MKIAFHFPRLSSGGVEKMRIILARELLARGHEVHFVLCQVVGEYLSQVPPGVKIVDLQASRTLRSFLPLRAYLDREAPDALISSLGPQNVVAILAGCFSKAKTKIFVTQHNALRHQSRSGQSLQQQLIPFLYRFLLPKADGVIAVSEGLADEVAEVARFDRGKIFVAYNPACPADPPQAGVHEPVLQRPYIISVGRLVEQKGYPDLLEAYAKLCRSNDRFDLVVLGVGPLMEELTTLAASLGVADRVHFLGFRKDPSSYLAAASLFVMASRYEGFGNVLVEALAAGVPVVSTNCDFGPSEILSGGKFGTLVEVGDVDGIERAMQAMLDCPMPAETLRLRAMDFAPDAVTDRYLDILGERSRACVENEA